MSAAAWTWEKRPVDRRTGPSQWLSVSTWWIPSCITGPPGFRARSARQAPALKLPGNDMLASARTTRPSAPSSISCFVRRAAPRRRNAWPTISTTPPSRQASRMRSPASSVSAIGFSTNTWRPNWAQARVCSSCASLGVATITPSTSGWPIASSGRAAARQPKRSANARRRPSSRLWQATSRSPARWAAAASCGAHIPVPRIATPVTPAAPASSRRSGAASCRERSRRRDCRLRAERTPRVGPREPAARSAPRGSAGPAGR